MIVRVHYVDGEHLELTPIEWADARGDGVDWCEVVNDIGSVRVSGHSLYWMYGEEAGWVVGGGAVGYANPLGETVVPESGNHQYREIEYMPDLPISAVKLGHWWPGKERPPRG